MNDILFKTDDSVFSYRTAGICVRDGRILLQNTADDTGFTFPGGHVAFGETSADALIREFKEEIGADIRVGRLKWVGEIFFPWGEKPCHQIGLYYAVSLINEEQIPLYEHFSGIEYIEENTFPILFYWISLDTLDAIELYPTDAADLLKNDRDDVRHFIYRE